MKLFKILLGLTLILMFMCLNRSFAQAPIASYSFDTDASDESGNYNGTLEGDAAIVTDPIRGGVLELTSTGYVRIPEEIALEMENFSFTAWVNYTGADDKWTGLMGMGLETAKSSPYWDFHIRGADEKGVLSYYGTEIDVWPGDGTAQVVTDYSLPPGEWAHLAFTFTLGTGGVVYADAEAQTQIPWNSTNDHDVSPKLIEPEIVAIGMDAFNQGTLDNTRIDDFKFFNVALTAEQVDAIYKGISAIEDYSLTVPAQYELAQNYPNPFNPRTIINYELPITNYVELSIYNVLGKKVKTLLSRKQQAGKHAVEWDATGFSSGVYYYVLRAGEFEAIKKMILLK
jgi:hypothetical protein